LGQPAAKQGDQVNGTCTHTVLVQSPTGPVPTPTTYTFSGVIDGNLSSSVRIGGQWAATQDSTATNTPMHLKPPPPNSFQLEPNNQATINAGSGTVRINGKPAARQGDTAKTCDEVGSPGTVQAAGTVSIGG
jgi:uncharacterized Zn-binding protein involved in type VI secretion